MVHSSRAGGSATYQSRRRNAPTTYQVEERHAVIDDIREVPSAGVDGKSVTFTPMLFSASRGSARPGCEKARERARTVRVRGDGSLTQGGLTGASEAWRSASGRSRGRLSRRRREPGVVPTIEKSGGDHATTDGRAYSLLERDTAAASGRVHRRRHDASHILWLATANMMRRFPKRS